MKKVMKSLSFLVAIAYIGISCSNPKPVKTIENLKSAIKGETSANAKYAAFSKKAAGQGYPNISKMFAATSAAEAVHIKNHKAVLTKLGESYESTPDSAKIDSTVINLQTGIDGETYEVTTMYPGFIKIAQLENSKDAITSFTWAIDAERKHARVYSDALKVLKSTGSDATVSATWYVCPKCGNVYSSIDGVESCELCGTASKAFQKM